ncbi:hypothetical protein SDC9_93487 [bioreactor metagenome]|uniref:Uncharacterized protein n=1 Tax=bioreactor metagenome TaxID=1076179 RepID=A0A645A3E9_9ZZZZ
MIEHENNCSICDNFLNDYSGRLVSIETKCPSYYYAEGRILDIRDNLVIMEFRYGGIIVICCDNICYVRPIEA